MPVALSYPGVYVEEISSGVHTITGVATSITAFVGRALRGPANEPVRVQSFAEFGRVFGGLWVDSTLGYAVAQFFLNGGSDALIVRVHSPAAGPVAAIATVSDLPLAAAEAGAQGNGIKVQTIVPPASGTPGLFDLIITPTSGAPVTLTDLSLAAGPNFVTSQLSGPSSMVHINGPLPAGPIVADGPETLTGGLDASAVSNLTIDGTTFVAANEGLWGDKLRLRVEHVASSADPSGTLFNLVIHDTAAGTTERFLNLSPDPANARFVSRVLKQQSNLIGIDGTPASTRPGKHDDLGPGDDPWDPAKNFSSALAGGGDGQPLTDNDISAPTLETDKHGIWALETADLFNLLCIPPLVPGGDIGAQTRTAAEAYCKRRRAMFIVDPLVAWQKPADITNATTGVDGTSFGLARSTYAALFFPFIRAPDPLREGQLGDFAPCGAVAGVMARTDAARGVWKAPAGIEATLSGVSELAVKLTDGENGQLNPLGINCLRAFPVIGRVVWGSRTLRGADQLASEWKYIPVRRTALFLEESLYRGTQWVVFEPNDEPLWAQIRLNIGGFMHNLFRQGAFQGKTPREAYFVKCDKDTTTQNDIDLGIVNIVVGFAPLKPAEFVVIQITQIAGQIET
jgi:phage tail sheath protein FI